VGPKERAIINRLKRIEGQMRGIQRAIEEHRGCEAVLTQIMSARAALDGVATEVVTTYIDECLREQPTEETRETIGRAVKLLSRLS
jgi:DNA-binding FrmR family transcriptional regulator